MRLVRIIGTVFLLWLGSLAQPVSASSHRITARTDSSEVHHFRIYYPINKTDIREDYMTNSHSLAVIREYLASSPRIDSIVIYSYASPEGPYRFNKQLAERRGETAKRYILSQVPQDRKFPESIIHLRPEAENWEGLREEVFLHYHGDDRNEVLTLLDSDMPDADKKSRLMTLNGRKPWRHILRHIMPRLRYATWITVWAPVHSAQQKPDTKVAAIVPNDPLPYIPTEQTRQHTLFALKTNLLYDLATIVNLSAEVPFTIHGERFSILYQQHFPWWSWGENDNEYCIRFLSMGGELRWWFNPKHHAATVSRTERDCLAGWFAGVYGMGGKWDFQWKQDICHQGEFWSAGLSIGYAMPVCRWANMEFSLSAGYASIPYRGYRPTDDYSLLVSDPDKHGTWHYIGPTKAEISLVIPINISKTFKWKGGEP